MDVVELRAREQKSERAEEPGESRDEHRPAAEIRGEAERVHGPRAAVGDEDEVAWVASLLRRHRAQRAGHSRVRDRMDSGGGVGQREREWPGDRFERALCELDGDGEVARGERARRDISEVHVRVRDGRLFTAAPVARGAGLGTCASRPDLQTAGRVEPRDRAAAGADLGDVDRRDPQELAGTAHQPAAARQGASDLVLARAGDGTRLDQRSLGGRPAHVERDRVFEAEPRCHPERGDDAGCRARLEREHRPARRVAGGHDTARGLHDRQRRVDLRGVEPAPDVGDVAAHQRPDVGVDDGRRAALVLALLAQDLARERDGHARKLFPKDAPDELLVLREAVGVEEAYGDRLDSRRTQLRRDGAHVRLVDGLQLGAVGSHALVQLQSQPPRHERVRLAPERVVHVRDAQAAKLEHVPEPRGRHERGQGAAPLEHGVRRDGRSVHDTRHALVARQACDGLDNGAGVARRRREDLADADPSVRGLEDDVGERPADVDSDPSSVLRHCHRVDLRYEIANRKPRPLRAAAAAVGREARDGAPARADRQRRPRRRHAARPARSRRAHRRLADARAQRPLGARARRAGRGDGDGPLARQQADARGPGGDLRGALRARGACGARGRARPRRAGLRADAQADERAREPGAQARRRGLPQGPLGLPRDLLPRLRTSAARRRGRASLLAGRALQPPRALDRGALQALGRLLPRLPRRVRGARRRRRRARHPREHAADGRGSRDVASVRAGMRVGADVGGTFTDVLAVDSDGRVRVTKVLSTPPDYDRAVIEAVGEVAGPAVEAIVHGTTVATNAVLERRGARTALVTTEGFRDVLELRRMRMPHLYDYFWTKPEPLVPRHLRFEIAERMTVSGEELKALDDGAARALAARLRDAAPEAVAVCLLHAHVHPRHEQRLGEILRAELPGVPVSLSSEILREQQEYERSATTTVNAYVRPLMERYLRQIRAGLGEAPLTIMQSSGGVMSAADAERRPVYALESGPAAGVVASAALARALGHENVITFDMGGTTAKASLIEGGLVSRSQEYEVGAALSSGSRLLRGSGELIRIPTIDIAEVGAGGGSCRFAAPAGGTSVCPPHVP